MVSGVGAAFGLGPRPTNDADLLAPAPALAQPFLGAAPQLRFYGTQPLEPSSASGGRRRGWVVLPLQPDDSRKVAGQLFFFLLAIPSPRPCQTTSRSPRPDTDGTACFVNDSRAPDTATLGAKHKAPRRTVGQRRAPRRPSLVTRIRSRRGSCPHSDGGIHGGELSARGPASRRNLLGAPFWTTRLTPHRNLLWVGAERPTARSEAD
jgi:hypothetical protein